MLEHQVERGVGVEEAGEEQVGSARLDHPQVEFELVVLDCDDLGGDEGEGDPVAGRCD